MRLYITRILTWKPLWAYSFAKALPSFLKSPPGLLPGLHCNALSFVHPIRVQLEQMGNCGIGQNQGCSLGWQSGVSICAEYAALEHPMPEFYQTCSVFGRKQI